MAWYGNIRLYELVLAYTEAAPAEDSAAEAWRFEMTRSAKDAFDEFSFELWKKKQNRLLEFLS